ncbi:MAG: hypothetical protein HOW73_02010 [Polyangiaceae bacterium]|nr:hypothetical protein [Polyangiaceae bacterium]
MYQDANGGAHLGSFEPNGEATADRAIASGDARLARYGGGMLIGYDDGGTAIQRLDEAGADVGDPAAVSAALPVADFESRGDGEVAWAIANGTELSVVRVRVCE